MVNEMAKIKGLGVFNPTETIGNAEIGEKIVIGQKILTKLNPRLRIVQRYERRAQTISAKDAGVFITRLGIGPGDVILEAGLGSGGLSLHLARVLGNSGTLVTVEARMNMLRLVLKISTEQSNAFLNSLIITTFWRR